MSRRHDLDWIRVCAFALLVLYHVGMYYVTWDWHVKSPFASDTIEPLMILTAPWRLSLLFLVSGTATAFLFEKVPAGFLLKRSWRLLAPLLFGMFVIVPPQVYYELVEKAPAAVADGYPAFWLAYLRGGDLYCKAPGDCIDAPTWNHLWFVAYLWVYTVAAWLLLRLPGVVAAMHRGAERRLSGIGILLWPIVLLGVARLTLVGSFESTHDLVDDWYNHAQYFPIFLLGLLIARSSQTWDSLQRLRWPASWLALASYVALIVYYAAYPDNAPEPPDALRYTMRIVWGVNQWCAIAAALGFARRFNPGDSKALRYLAPAVFPVYILHQTVIVAVAHNFQRFQLHPSAEGPILILLTFAGCFAAYELVRRVRWLRPLFGLKPDQRAVEPVPTAHPVQ